MLNITKQTNLNGVARHTLFLEMDEVLDITSIYNIVIKDNKLMKIDNDNLSTMNQIKLLTEAIKYIDTFKDNMNSSDYLFWMDKKNKLFSQLKELQAIKKAGK